MKAGEKVYCPYCKTETEHRVTETECKVGEYAPYCIRCAQANEVYYKLVEHREEITLLFTRLKLEIKQRQEEMLTTKDKAKAIVRNGQISGLNIALGHAMTCFHRSV